MRTRSYPIKHRYLIPLVGLALLVGTAGVAYAFMTAISSSAHNALSAGAVSVAVIERDSTGALIVDTSQVSYGQTSKKVTLKVPTGYAEAIVRARIVPPQVSIASGATSVAVAYDMGSQVLSAPDANGLVTVGGFVYHFASDWNDHWFWKDGYFYARHTVSAGEESPTLLTGVTLADGYTPAGEVAVTVLCDALQPTPSEAAASWGVQVDGSGVVSSLG